MFEEDAPENADVAGAEESEDEEDSEPEAPEMQCLSEDDTLPDAEILMTEIEDLGKRKGTNEARDNIVKKFKQTPDNPNNT